MNLARSFRKAGSKSSPPTRWEAIYGETIEVPDPQDPQTFTSSKLDWSEVEENREFLDFIKQAISIRKSVPDFTYPRGRQLVLEDFRSSAHPPPKRRTPGHQPRGRVATPFRPVTCWPPGARSTRVTRSPSNPIPLRSSINPQDMIKKQSS